MTASSAQVRRPWLPAALRAHGWSQSDVGTLSYLVLDEIVGSSATMLLSAWPWADLQGRVRFAVDDSTRGVTVDVHALEHALYRGWLERPPRIGDVFAAVVPQAVHDVQEPDEAPQWDRPIADLVDGPVYDLTREGRTVAALADSALVSPVLPAVEASRLGLAGRQDVDAPRAPRRDSVGPDGDDD
ncbi:hypothetical protein SAMN05661080_03588 [Modestobacter sp. DSM 44400]|uniref:hypothetical protein n=1 Tax=Modestobacter sp. DSM 44400 TaxID=1550230 RepID=UPI00089AF6D3|nr:hypothetical protein [Modestobacter sp. DSM 44400]SDY47595.1 hypothetical protein SAMN05661080_03588 [Modestobacter sp. DSM 44400]